MKVPETIQTKRLLLRKPRIDDTSAIFETYAQDPEVTHYPVWKPQKTFERQSSSC
jgi:RimJ/RimL family protein N-acetyltransferase